jgi:(2Fe-2S) ferredoxin
VFLVRSDRVHRWIERLEVDDVSELVDLDLGVLGSDDPPGVGVPGPANLPLVCTNGRHDPCCADFGRPVVRALREAGVEVWESSHVGGDRFAANLVCLPTGVYFGRVQPEEAERILRDHEGGLIDLDRYRGRSCYPPLLQAAEIFARRELGQRRLDGLRILSATGHATESLVVLHDDGGREVRVRVARERAEPAALTCADLGQSPPWHQRLVSIDVATR